MNVATEIMKVKDVARRAWNSRKGDFGVSIQYVLKEIKRGKLKADGPLKSEVGTTYYLIDEQDFLAWEERRRGTQENEP
jgi:hypothetical protein